MTQATEGRSENCLTVVSGICFAHGPHDGPQCPQWPRCATDPHKAEYVAMATDYLATATKPAARNKEHRRCRQVQPSVRVFAFCNVCDHGVVMDALQASGALAGFTPWPQHCGANMMLIARDVTR